MGDQVSGGADERRAVWPEFFWRPDASLRSAVAGLDALETSSRDAVERGHRLQLAGLAWWAARYSPHYRGLAASAEALGRLVGAPDDFWSVWRSLPTLKKSALRTSPGSIFVDAVPALHEPVTTILTSGTTGTPVEVRTTALTRLVWHSLTIREHLWQERDFSRRLGAIRHYGPDGREPRGGRAPSWGRPVDLLFQSGPASGIHIGLPLDVLSRWLREFDPHYLLCSPSVAAALLDESQDPPPSLTEVRCVFEPLDDALEARLWESWGVDTTDIYSANETGYIAFRCKEGGRLHVQDESVLVEIIDHDGRPCGEGEWGRVVVTALHNLATPLLRYELGDYATKGEACACGRPSATIGRVLGRVRNLAKRPDGRKFWPVSLAEVRRIAPITQAQYVQTALDHVELRVVVTRPLSASESDAAVACAQASLDYPFRITVTPVGSLEYGPTGKFEEFLSLVD